MTKLIFRMVNDFNKAETPTEFETSVCIVGSGAAGITLALALARKGFEVLMIESGGHHFDEGIQNLYHSEVVARPHKGIHTGRFRQYGGTTTRWGGASP